MSGLAKITLASSVRPEPVRPVIPRISPLWSVKEASCGPLRTERPRTSSSGSADRVDSVRRLVTSSRRPIIAETTLGRLVVLVGAASTTAPSRSTVISSQTSNTSLR